MNTKNKKIKYGNVDIVDSEFEPKNMKARVTMMMDMDVLDEVRKKAAADHMPYQTWINRKMRSLVFGDKNHSNRFDVMTLQNWFHTSEGQNELKKVVEKAAEKIFERKLKKRA